MRSDKKREFWVNAWEDSIVTEFNCPKCGGHVDTGAFWLLKQGETCECQKCHTIFQIIDWKYSYRLKIKEVSEGEKPKKEIGGE